MSDDVKFEGPCPYYEPEEPVVTWPIIGAVLGMSEYKINKYRHELKKRGIVFKCKERRGKKGFPTYVMKAYPSKLRDFTQEKAKKGEIL